jgi:chromosome segregation ATPase
MKKQELVELSTRLLELPQEIADLQLEILQKSNDVQDVSKEIIRTETKIRVNIANKVDENGKKVYSNEDARKAAFQEFTESDLDLNELKEKSSQLDQEVQKLKIKLEFCGNEQRNIRSILQFFATAVE